ncbi:MAG: hypothetical protein WCF65_01040 [Parachlamydiaceae bacterium]
MRKKVFISWSSGKDSAWALHILRQDPSVDIAGLFCTVNKAFNRVAVHGVRTALLEQQAREVDLPLYIVEIPYPCDNEIYVKAFKTFVMTAEQMGISYFAFGDLFLEDVRAYREEILAGTGVKPLFPLWGMSTHALSKEMIAQGLKAVITCLDPKHLGSEFAGRNYDESFLKDIPASVDPCGENGEFHSFAFDGPMFKDAIEIMSGRTIIRDGACYTDILPKPYDSHTR